MYIKETHDCDKTGRSSTISMHKDKPTVATETASLLSQKVPQQGSSQATDNIDTLGYNQVRNDTVAPHMEYG